MKGNAGVHQGDGVRSNPGSHLAQGKLKATPENALRLAARMYAGRDWHTLSSEDLALVGMLEELGYLVKNTPVNGFVGRAAQDH